MIAARPVDRHVIDALLRQATETAAVAGVVAMATTAEDLLYEGCSGTADLASGEPMRLDHIFRLRSMTKAITAVAVMQLVERGLLGLDAPIAGILPQIAAPLVVDGFDCGDRPRLRPATGPITLRHLLTHTAGYSNPAWSADLVRVTAALGLPPRPGSFDELARTPLLFDPGTGWSYSIAIDILGHAIAALSSQAIDDHLATQVTGPLGMVDTTFTLSPAQRGRLVALHLRQPDGSLRVGDAAAGNGPEFLAAGGGLLGTGGDYIRFLRMLLRGGSLDGARILNAATVAMMGRNHTGEIDVTPMISIDPAVSHDCDLHPAMTKKWSLMGLVNTAPGRDGRSIGSQAWAGAMNTYFWIDPACGIAGVMLSQSLPFADPQVLALLGTFERSIYGS